MRIKKIQDIVRTFRQEMGVSDIVARKLGATDGLSRIGMMRVRSDELKQFASDLVRRHTDYFPSDAAFPVDPTQAESAPDRVSIRRVVERNILPEYDHPRIIEAVTDYLYDRLWMMS